MDGRKKIYLKSNFKSLLIAILLFIGIWVYANVTFASDDVSYDNVSSDLKSTNVKGAMDELYKMCKGVINVGGQDIETVTSGDGLYKDDNEKGRYIYKGANPNNYISFNNELWRIIAIESDGSYKIIRNTSLDARAFDNANNRSSTYCNDKSNGCNAWGSNTTTYDNNQQIVTSISDTYSSSATYALPTSVASLNTYLNGEYYNTLTSTVQNLIDSHYFNVGTVSASSSNDLKTDMLEEEKYKWKGKIGLLNITDYVKASNNGSCNKAYDYNANSACYNNSNNHNWIINSVSNNPRFINGKGGSRSNIWGISTTGYKIGSNGTASASYGVSPVLYLKSSVKIVSGIGSKESPYILS